MKFIIIKDDDISKDRLRVSSQFKQIKTIGVLIQVTKDFDPYSNEIQTVSGTDSFQIRPKAIFVNKKKGYYWMSEGNERVGKRGGGMREIKFRAWDKEEKEMLELVTVGCTRKDSWGPLYIKDNWINGFDHNNYDIMQYTGLKDKNGVEIFEGDIVHLTSDEGINYNALIVFKDGGFCAIDGTESNYGFRRYDLSRFDLYLDVIGNIYENPELLEVAE